MMSHSSLRSCVRLRLELRNMDMADVKEAGTMEVVETGAVVATDEVTAMAMATGVAHTEVVAIGMDMDTTMEDLGMAMVGTDMAGMVAQDGMMTTGTELILGLYPEST